MWAITGYNAFMADTKTMKILGLDVDVQAFSGLLLLACAVLALALANGPWGDWYEHLLHHQYLKLAFDGEVLLKKSLNHWINDGLMALFFFYVGLEVKRELTLGHLNTPKKMMLPLVAAAGGMIFPGLIYAAIAWDDAASLRGWAVPTATDIAFALGMLALLGNKVPTSLRVFLLALAIFDDLGAIIIIALFYTADIQPPNLAWATLFVGCLLVMNRAGVNRGAPYILVGILLWFCVLKSGVHATLAGVITALCVPISSKKNEQCLAKDMEEDLAGLSNFAILPLFALANAGVRIPVLSWEIFVAPVTLGVTLGLLFGKGLGITFSSWLAVHLGAAHLPKGVTWSHIFGVALLAGVGFTMSLFIATLGFGSGLLLTEAKIGVLIGSTLSVVLGLLLLRRTL